MADIPEITGQQVQAQAMPGVRVNTEAPIEAFGGGQSAERAAGATQGLLDETQKIVATEKQKADQVAHMAADSQAANLETQLQVATSKMRGRDAFGAPDMVKAEWDKGVEKIKAGLTNPQQQMAFAGSAASRWDSLNRSTQMHVAGEGRQLDEQTTASYIDTTRNSAVLNSFDDSKVQTEVNNQRAALIDWANRNGVRYGADGKDSEIFKNKVADELSKTHLAVIQNRLDNDQNDKAKSYFDLHKEEMTAPALNSAAKSLERSEIVAQSNEVWDKVKHYTLSDGITPDEGKIEKAIRADDSYSDERKEQLVKLAKGRAGEELANRRREESANERAFMNDAIDVRKSGATLADALKLADKYGKDDYDTQVKQAAIQKLYAPPTESDPVTKMNLWEGVQKNTLKKADIDKAFYQDKTINVKDWEELSKDFSRIQVDGVAPSARFEYERVKELAEASIGDKQKRAQFLDTVKQAAQGQPPEAMFKIAQDKLKTDPATQSHLLWIKALPVGGQPQWKSDQEKSDAAKLGIGMVYQDVGTPQTAAITQGIQRMSGVQKVSPADIDQFASQLGGYDAIKTGTPVNNAILSLSKRGKPVTPANIKAVLQSKPDGNW